MEKETAFALVAAFPIALFVASIASSSGTLTPDKIIDRPEKYTGEKVTVEATVQQGSTMCTQIACPADNRCCNTCSGSVQIGDEKKIRLVGEEIGCSGNSCELSCTPEAGKKYVINGVIVHNSGRLSMNISNFEKVKN